MLQWVLERRTIICSDRGGSKVRSLEMCAQLEFCIPTLFLLGQTTKVSPAAGRGGAGERLWDSSYHSWYWATLFSL